MSIKIAKGPESDKVSREDAIKALQSHHNFPKGSSFELEDVNGRWVAAFVESATPPDFEIEDVSVDEESLDEPSDSPEEESTGPEGPEEEGEGSEDSEGGLEGKLDSVLEALESISTALGIDPLAGDIDGLDALGEGEIAEELPPAPEGDGSKKIIHEKAMSPGDVPPGGTPLGTPSFAHVNDSNPWKEAAIEGVKEFSVSERIGSTPLNVVRDELGRYANEVGYSITELSVGGRGNERTASVVVSKRV